MDCFSHSKICKFDMVNRWPFFLFLSLLLLLLLIFFLPLMKPKMTFVFPTTKFANLPWSTDGLFRCASISRSHHVPDWLTESVSEGHFQIFNLAQTRSDYPTCLHLSPPVSTCPHLSPPVSTCLHLSPPVSTCLHLSTPVYTCLHLSPRFMG